MAVLHKEFIKYNKEIKLTSTREESLKKSRKELRRKIRNWFKDNKSNELQPKFRGQGSFGMNTVINPIPTYDDDGEKLLKYDLDDGVYFIEKDDEDNKKSINTWHDWVCDSVENHTGKDSIRKTTCVRVVFADGHHIDLPIYYKDGTIELTHKTKSWLESDPKEFVEWFNDFNNSQLKRIVRYLKAWKNYREDNNSNLKLPSGFELTILAANNHVKDDNDDKAFRETIRNINTELNKTNGFKCLRPTTPKGEDVFAAYSDTRRDNFLNTLSSLLSDLDRADNEKNFRKASEYLRNNQFGDRFPLGEDKKEEARSNQLASSLGAAAIIPKPYGY